MRVVYGRVGRSGSARSGADMQRTREGREQSGAIDAGTQHYDHVRWAVDAGWWMVGHMGARGVRRGSRARLVEIRAALLMTVAMQSALSEVGLACSTASQESVCQLGQEKRTGKSELAAGERRRSEPNRQSAGRARLRPSCSAPAARRATDAAE